MRWLAVIAALWLTPSVASECTAPTNLDRYLPPAHMRQEPTETFVWFSKEQMQALSRKAGNPFGAHFLGYYDPETDVILICKGLTGEALRVIRMHEEAHKRGWWH